jgi:hypothetical protein
MNTFQYNNDFDPFNKIGRSYSVKLDVTDYDSFILYYGKYLFRSFQKWCNNNPGDYRQQQAPWMKVKFYNRHIPHITNEKPKLTIEETKLIKIRTYGEAEIEEKKMERKVIKPKRVRTRKNKDKPKVEIEKTEWKIVNEEKNITYTHDIVETTYEVCEVTKSDYSLNGIEVCISTSNIDTQTDESSLSQSDDIIEEKKVRVETRDFGMSTMDFTDHDLTNERERLESFEIQLINQGKIIDNKFEKFRTMMEHVNHILNKLVIIMDKSYPKFNVGLQIEILNSLSNETHDRYGLGLLFRCLDYMIENPVKGKKEKGKEKILNIP